MGTWRPGTRTATIRAGGEPRSSRVQPHIGGRTERTRPARPAVRMGRGGAVTIAEIETAVQEKIENDD